MSNSKARKNKAIASSALETGVVFISIWTFAFVYLYQSLILVWVLFVSISLIFIKRFFNWRLAKKIKEATCEKCGSEFSITKSVMETITAAVPRETKRKVVGPTPDRDDTAILTTTCTEEKGFRVITLGCDSCGHKRTQRESFSRKVNVEKIRTW